jgi:hypothetical protein
MGLAGVLLVALGVAGFFADDFLAIGAELAGPLVGGSSVVTAIGAGLVLTALARTALGAGVFPLAIGVGALVAQVVTRWVDLAPVQARQPWVGIAVAVLIVLGAAAVVWSLGQNLDDDSATAALVLFAICSLVADIVYDFGQWDPLMNVATAAFTASAVFLGVWTMTSGSIEVLAGVHRDRVRSREPGWDHPSVVFAFAWGERAAAGGLGTAVVLITFIVSTAAPTWLDVLLTLPAVLGSYLAVSVVAVPLLVRSVGLERFARVNLDLVDDPFEDVVGQWLRSLAAYAGGYLVVATVVELVVFQPAAWLVVVLAVAATAGAVAVWRFGFTAWSRLVEQVVGWADAPVNRTPTIGQVLAELARGDPVYRLVPGAENLSR